MMGDLDPRIGRHVGGRRVYPALNLNGQAYTRNGASTLSLGGGFFVVLPAFGKADEDALAELRALVSPNAPPVDAEPVSKKGK